VIEESDGEMVWSADGASFLYIRLDENHRPSRVYRHHLGQDPTTDELIFEETDPGWFMNVWRSRSRRFAVIHLTDHDSAEAHLLDLHDPTQVIGQLDTPLLSPQGDEREGYVPNVIYSCGALIHDGVVVLPYGCSDASIRFAFIDLAGLLSLLTESRVNTNSPLTTGEAA
jgi:hypothetical protein